MSSLLSLVRRAVNLNVLKCFAPTNQWIEARRCEAWFAIREAYPHVNTGHLEAVIKHWAQRHLVRTLRAFQLPTAANDVVYVDATAVAS